MKKKQQNLNFVYTLYLASTAAYNANMHPECFILPASKKTSYKCMQIATVWAIFSTQDAISLEKGKIWS